MDSRSFILRNVADLGHNENITEVHLRWLVGPSVKKVLQMLKRCTNLRRLSLETETFFPQIDLSLFPPLEELCDFIMELKHLTFLHFIYHYVHNCGHFKSEVDGVKDFVLPLRPNFKFYISCCEMFDESRASEKNNENK